VRWRSLSGAALAVALLIGVYAIRDHDHGSPAPQTGRVIGPSTADATSAPVRSSTAASLPVVGDRPEAQPACGGCGETAGAVPNPVCLDRTRCVDRDGGWCTSWERCVPYAAADPRSCSAPRAECADVRTWFAWSTDCDLAACDRSGLDRCYGAAECDAGGGSGGDAFDVPGDPPQTCSAPDGCVAPNPFDEEPVAILKPTPAGWDAGYNGSPGLKDLPVIPTPAQPADLPGIKEIPVRWGGNGRHPAGRLPDGRAHGAGQPGGLTVT
jgi:hypothetical protein